MTTILLLATIFSGFGEADFRPKFSNVEIVKLTNDTFVVDSVYRILKVEIVNPAERYMLFVEYGRKNACILFRTNQEKFMLSVTTTVRGTGINKVDYFDVWILDHAGSVPNFAIRKVAEEGVEPSRPNGQRILSP